MKKFTFENFRELLSTSNPYFKITEHNDGFYLTMGLSASESELGIGTKNNKFSQTWELKNIIDDEDNEPIIIFSMWGNKPDFSPSGVIANMFSSNHEGKEISTPISTVFPILLQLTSQVPSNISIDKFTKTQGLEKIFKNKLQYYEDFPLSMLKNLKQEIGNTCLIYPEIKGDFPVPPFNPHLSKINKNGEILNTKMFNGTLNLFQNALVLDNQKDLHYPKYDLGYTPESDYIILIRILFGRYTLSFKDKSGGETIEFAIEDFQFIGQNS